jgi:hypothetical protein
MTELPTYNTVRDEAQAAMQRVVDELPPGSRVAPQPEGDPYGCEGDGVFYTGHWGVYPGAGFDGQAFVDGLPSALAGDFVEEQKVVELSYPAVGFIATGYGNTGVSISVVDVDGETVVDILSTSRCAQPPATSAP